MSFDSHRIILNPDTDHFHEFPIEQPEMVIGREAGVDILIDSASVSRRHARIIFRTDGYYLEDLSSSNGTYLNDSRIDKPALLTPGDHIRLGLSVNLIFEAPVAIKDIVISDTGVEAATSMVDPHERETTIGEVDLLNLYQEPPEFEIIVAGEQPMRFKLTQPTITIGRQDDNDIVVVSKLISRHHGRLERTPSGYRMIVLPDVTNPMYFQGRQVVEILQFKHGDTLRIGGTDPGLMVTMIYHDPAAAIQPEIREIKFGEKSRLQIGRDLDNDVVVDAPTVSRFHAQLERTGQRYRIRDLNSSNGTYVNDQPVVGDVWLKLEDTVRIGPYRFVVGQDQLSQYDESGGLQVDARGLNKWVRKDLNILQDISLRFSPREFVVVVGQSGGGKSTLVDAIAGYRPATHGQVLVNGIDVYRNFDAIRHHIGFVPQKDIIHMELTVFQALDYAAQLRMPSDTSKKERHQRVLEVLQDLDLVHRKDVQISGLSGGQQKRVSIGVELLTKPGLFFLDEPSSGLDPGTETALMQLMRRLADQGRTIVLITHATKNVMLADKVVFLARGGYLAWFGPPEEALEYFNQYRSERDRRAGPMEFDEIYAILDDSSQGSAAEWAERYRAHPAYERYIRAPLSLSKGGAAVPTAEPGSSKQNQHQVRPNTASALRQFLILSSRNFKILTRDRFSLILMLASAPVIGLLDVILSSVLGRTPYSFNDGSFTDITTIFFLLPVNGVMVGALAQMREIVKEADIYKRERLVNLKIIPYVFSKVWVAGLLAFYQAGAYMLIRYLTFDIPGGPLEFFFIFITMTLAVMAGMMLGLFSSALSPNANAVPLIVILLIIPQVVLGGALIPLPSVISAPTSTRWAFEAFMATTGAGSDVAADVCWELPEKLRDHLNLDDKRDLGCTCMGLNVLKQDSCDFPGLGSFYDPAVDELPPAAPAELGDPPPEPELPIPPSEPVDQSDTVAVADYLTALSAYQDQVEQIQMGYKNSLETYQAQAEVYQAQAIAYQQSLAEYEIARNAAVGKAEGLLNQFQKDFSWTFVDKTDREAFFGKVFATWLAQSTIILVLFVGILVLMWRKDRT